MILRIIFAALIAVLPLAANAFEVFACEPEWASLVREIAGEDIQVTTATTAFQDPHYVQAKPSLIAAARNADLLICSGADLEIGWLPLLLRRAGNAAIQPGSPGNFVAADFVRRIEIPKVVDRSGGDVHPQGNPHIHLSPRNIERIAKALGERLIRINAGDADNIQNGLDDFLMRWDEATGRWEDEGESLRGMRLVAHHTSFSYLADWLNLDIVATLEPKPGVPPSGAYLSKLLAQLQASPPAAIIRTPYQNEKPSLWLAERVGTPAIVLPFTVGGTPQATDLFSLYDETIRLLREQQR
ncbi:MAG TPA: zinc ABC transporter substrate-binding protein [Woeseiaceae bacterium]|nr:zinc ABC transporter substrate-binding protein [Woeseiaceae bacterium]